MGKTHYLIVLLVLWTSYSFAQEHKDFSTELTRAQSALAGQDYKTAYQEYLHIAEKHRSPLAEFNIALFYHFGWGRPANESIACNWYAKAAEGQIPAAQHFYADCLRDGLSGTTDPEQAAIWYRRAAENGHILSLCSLAELYVKGRGVSKDSQQGLALCQQAANTGLSKAMVQMARFYLSDDPKLRNGEKAIIYLQQAAQLRDVNAQFILGEIHRDGLDGEYVDYFESRQWFELAAANGYVPAYYQVGRLYFNAPLDPATKALPADALAKSYLWLSAAKQRSKQKDEQNNSKQMLDKIATVMPKTWLGDLNKKLNEHLARYPESSVSESVPTYP